MKCISLIAGLLFLAGCQPDETTSHTALLKQSSPVGENFTVLSEPPEPLLDKMALLYSPDNTEWSKIVDEFVENGHPILPHMIRELQEDEKISPDLAKQITARIGQSPAIPVDAQRILSLMETACYADITCHPVEYPLRISTLNYVKANIDSPGAQNALEWIRSTYRSGLPHDPPGDETGVFHGLLVKAMQGRLNSYAKLLLGSTDPQQSSK